MHKAHHTPMRVARKWARIIHRDLSFFFAGVILIYAFSGIILNHKRDFNPNYSIEQHRFRVEENLPLQAKDFDEERVKQELLTPYREERNYTKHYSPNEQVIKVFLKGGSSLVLNLESGEGLYESVRKRYVVSSMNRLHYNPNKWWTVFSDVFAVSLMVITITGLIINKGKNGLLGRGGVELLLGILIPILFIFCS